MLSLQIQAWINSEGSYRDGVALLVLTSSSKKSFFETSLQKSFILPEEKVLLIKELQKYVSVEPASSSPKPIPNSSIPEPIEMQRLRQRAKLLHKQEAANHTALFLVDSDEERHGLAKETMELIRPELDRIYAGIKEWETTGVLPVISAEKQLKQTIIELMNKRGSIKSRISVLKGKLKKNPGVYERGRIEQKLREKEALLLEIQKDLFDE